MHMNEGMLETTEISISGALYICTHTHVHTHSTIKEEKSYSTPHFSSIDSRLFLFILEINLLCARRILF